jgi:hypothetical protein
VLVDAALVEDLADDPSYEVKRLRRRSVRGYRSLVPHLDTSDYSGWRKRMLITGSDDVGPELNPGGADYPSGRWWLLREGVKAFILHENGVKELYWMATDPYQKRNKAKQTDPALLERLTTTVKTMKTARGETRRRLEEAP